MTTLRIVIEDLGAWRPGARLFAEYDAATCAIRINARCVEALRARYGNAVAESFVACAVAHELYHIRARGGREVEARACAQRATGIEPRIFEEMLLAASC